MAQAQGGGYASTQGKTLETLIEGICSRHKFEIIPYSQYKKKPENYGKELLLKNIPYTTIYGHKGYTEFLLISEKYNAKIRIECKWQQSAGSVDEKLPYLYLNCITQMPEDHIIVVIDGAGWKSGSIPWLKTSVLGKLFCKIEEPQKRIDIFNMKEFLTWANTFFRNPARET